MLVYLAGPIDAVPDCGISWRENVIDKLSARGHHTYSPAHAFFLSPASDVMKIARGDAMKIARQVDAINRLAIGQCDVVLAYLPRDYRTVGTPREIEYARTIGKPVATVIDPPDQHLSLWDVYRTASFDEAVDWIEELSRGAYVQGNGHRQGNNEGPPGARG